MSTPIYLDYAATTPVDPDVANAMADCLRFEGNFGNPASRSHKFGWMAEQSVERARKQVADMIGATVRDIVWTSGATESDNLALKGVFERFIRQGEPGHLITSCIEHKAILDVATYLETQGVAVTYLTPDARGVIEPEQVQAALRADTRLVSLMAVNNEIGTITDIAAVGALLADHAALLHVDAAQACGKIDVDVAAWRADLVSLCAHKMYGPKGIGALYVRHTLAHKPSAQIHGGGHERGMRSGTLATHQIVGFGEAAALVMAKGVAERARVAELKQRLLAHLASVEGVHINGEVALSTGHHLNVSVAGVDGAVLLASLASLAIASGSACNSASMAPSHVLRGIGLSDELALAGLRFSFGRYTTEADIDAAGAEFVRCILALR